MLRPFWPLYVGLSKQESYHNQTMDNYSRGLYSFFCQRQKMDLFNLGVKLYLFVPLSCIYFFVVGSEPLKVQLTLQCSQAFQLLGLNSAGLLFQQIPVFQLFLYRFASEEDIFRNIKTLQASQGFDGRAASDLLLFPVYSFFSSNTALLNWRIT